LSHLDMSNSSVEYNPTVHSNKTDVYCVNYNKLKLNVKLMQNAPTESRDILR
jgi:hypothetical protein